MNYEKRIKQLEEFVLKEFTKTFNLQNSVYALKKKIETLETDIETLQNSAGVSLL